MFARGYPCIQLMLLCGIQLFQMKHPVIQLWYYFIVTDIDFTFAYQITDKTLSAFILTWIFWNNICVININEESTQFRYNLVTSTDEN